MKCTSCNQRNGNTRCEGCHSLFCLSCMNRHHDELVQQFQLLTDMRNELKESIDIAETKSKHENKLPCFNEVNEWEQEMIKHIQAIANRTRENLCEIMVKNIVQIRDQFEQLSTTMQQQQKEENYLENELEKVKLQLCQLKEAISHINEKVHVKTSNNIDWDRLIHVINNENSIQQNNFHTDQEKQSSFRPVNPLSFTLNDSESFSPIWYPDLSQNTSTNFERYTPLIQNIVPPDSIDAMIPNLDQPSSWTTVARNRQSTP
ncbi:unnamed protein product [Adineta steineri]|uniref:B box-type domain-containing protein n=1 Tax=Adineta steineri TaxID=433720 RepID=A0A814LSA0_9BILA|nr:unnamed protein product [Adineta steineri]CAF1121671.1 unnamed protein product [Adineta steineri]